MSCALKASLNFPAPPTSCVAVVALTACLLRNSSASKMCSQAASSQRSLLASFHLSNSLPLLATLFLALLHWIQEFKTQLCHPVLTDSAFDQPGNEWIQAEKILEQRFVPGSTVLEYLVRWCGNPPQPDSWEPRRNLNNELFTQWRNERR